MSNDFSAFKAMAVGIALMVAGVALAPALTNGQFDMLRITKTVAGKKGHGTSSTPTTTTTDPFTSTATGRASPKIPRSPLR